MKSSNFLQDNNDNRILRRSMTNQTIHSLKSMIIEGQWNFQEDDYDRRQLKSMGIVNLVEICHDIMRETYQSIRQKAEKRTKSPLTSDAFQLIKLNRFQRLTDIERNHLRREKIFHLMTIIAEATSTSSSISQLVRIWREVSQHISKEPEFRPVISYKTAFEHLIRTPNDHLLEIALHASVISTHNDRDLRRLARDLHIGIDQFDMKLIRNSTKYFQDLIQILRKQRKQEKFNEQCMDTTTLPFERKKKRGLSANVSGTRFPLVCQAVDISGFTINPNADFTANLIWIDNLISMDIVSALKSYQKINHFPNMNEISRKDSFAKNYQRLSILLPNEYNFLPKTWIFPIEYDLWRLYAMNKSKIDSTIYILKPVNSSMSDGIAIHCDYKQIKPIENYIIQEYIREPLLLDGFKFDIRMYVLITSCDPLRVFVFNNGILRRCQKKYSLPNSKNIYDLSIHLTNYQNDNDDFNIDYGKHRTLDYLYDYLKEQNQDVSKLRNEIHNMILKSIFLVQPYLYSSYKKCRSESLSINESVCFELLGFDILIDKNYKPQIIEINRCPNFDITNQIEYHMKMKLLLDTLKLLNFRVSDRINSENKENFDDEYRLFTRLGRIQQKDQLTILKENLSILHFEQQREIYEEKYSGDFIRLFPVNNKQEMEYWMNILTKSFEMFYTEKSSWKIKYTQQWNEQELINEINQLEYLHSQSSPVIKHKIRSNSLTKQISTQTPMDISRSISLSSENIPKRIRISNGDISRPNQESEQLSMRGISANRITEKQIYQIQSSLHENHRSNEDQYSNDKSQMVTSSKIIREIRQYQEQRNKTSNKNFKLTTKEFHHLHLLIFDEMNKFSIHYPNKSDKEIDKIFIEIIEHWDYYKFEIGQFWLGKLDTNKRQTIIDIVWNNIYDIIKRICIINELIEQLPLYRYLFKLKHRLLSNHGQIFWDACLDRHNSWETLFIKSTKMISQLELDCCYRFIDLCKQSLFIVYQYSNESRIS